MRASRVVGEERLAIIGFLTFVARYGDEARDLLDRGTRCEGTKLRIDARTEEITEFVRKQVPLYSMYGKYALRRACRLLEVDYLRSA